MIILSLLINIEKCINLNASKSLKKKYQTINKTMRLTTKYQFIQPYLYQLMTKMSQFCVNCHSRFYLVDKDSITITCQYF